MRGLERFSDIPDKDGWSPRRVRRELLAAAESDPRLLASLAKCYPAVLGAHVLNISIIRAKALLITFLKARLAD